jgi:hypothetical protein
MQKEYHKTKKIIESRVTKKQDSLINDQRLTIKRLDDELRNFKVSSFN